MNLNTQKSFHIQVKKQVGGKKVGGGELER